MFRYRIFIFLICVSVTQLFAIVVHPGYEPDLATWTDRPTDDWVGRFNSNASCVVVDRDFIITTRHQCGSVNSIIVVAGQSYLVRQIMTPSANSDGSAPDLRLIQLTQANFSTWAPLYRKRSEFGKQIVMGGYGKKRGTELTAGSSGTVYGYTWDNSPNTISGWCTNRIEGSLNNFVTGITCGLNWKTDILTADFDDPGYQPANPTAWEGALAEYDSGGGWFIFDDNQWKLAGLSNATERFGESHFRNAGNPAQYDPDGLYAVRISSYLAWIDSVLQSCGRAGDFNRDCQVDLIDMEMLAENWLATDCQETCLIQDLQPDGKIDLADWLLFTQEFLTPSELTN